MLSIGRVSNPFRWKSFANRSRSISHRRVDRLMFARPSESLLLVGGLRFDVWIMLLIIKGINIIRLIMNISYSVFATLHFMMYNLPKHTGNFLQVNNQFVLKIKNDKRKMHKFVPMFLQNFVT